LSARIHFRLIALLSLALILCSSTIASANPLTEQKPTPPPETGAAATPAAPATMPPLPAGVPPRFTFGLSNNDAGWLTGSGVPWGMRYQYLSAGVNTGDGWATWNRNGEFATNYINESRAANTIPVFIYYQILQSAPAYDEFGNLNNPSTMRAYFDDFKLLMIKCGAAGGTIWVDLEPDLTGTMQQHETNTADNAALQPASVTASGHPDVQGYPNNFRGVYRRSSTCATCMPPTSAWASMSAPSARATTWCWRCATIPAMTGARTPRARRPTSTVWGQASRRCSTTPPTATRRGIRSARAATAGGTTPTPASPPLTPCSTG
jgi:hypothetical protein